MASEESFKTPIFPALDSSQRATSTSKLTSTSTSTSKLTSANVRQKVLLTPGHSLLDWIRLGNSGKDLTGVGGMKGVVWDDELSKHNTDQDAWTCVRGLVYNITPYLDFHPGGREYLMKGAGIDATDLFDNYHQWINAESMLGKCLVGKLKKRMQGPKTKETAKSTVKTAEFLAPPVPVQPQEGQPRYEWFQKEDSLMIVIYTRWPGLRTQHLTIDYLQKRNLKMTTRIRTKYYILNLQLDDEISTNYSIKVNEKHGKAEIILKKMEIRKWPGVGRPLPDNGKLFKLSDLLLEKDLGYRTGTISEITEATHDVNLYKVTLTPSTRLPVPIGYHVYLYYEVENVSVQRPYTVVDSVLLLNEWGSMNRTSGEAESGVNFTESGVPKTVTESAVNGPESGVPKTESGVAKTESGVAEIESGIIKTESGVMTDEFSLDDHIYLLIKIYDDGLFTTALKTMSVGDSLRLSPSAGDFHLAKLLKCQELVLFAAGTGITPMIRLINYTLRQNKIPVHLVFFNKTENDIIWRENFRRLSEENVKFEMTNVLSQAGETWTGPRGRICDDIIKEVLPEVSNDVFVCICGPSLFTQLGLKLLKENGVKEENIHPFLS